MSATKVKRTGRGKVLHPPVERSLKKLGEDISLARRIRKLSVEDFSRRAGISRATLHRLERGDPGISVHALAMSLHVLGRMQALEEICDLSRDIVALRQIVDGVPKRVSRRRVAEPQEGEEGGPQPTADGRYVGF